VAVEQLAEIRDRLLPMLAFVQQEYGYRVPAGYPIIQDDLPRGVVGIELDPAHSLSITTDGERLFADFAYRSSRYDARSSASREKFGGASVVDRRDLPATVSDQALRNLLAVLMSRWNSQQTILYITDA
jgi:hypothetical protein